MMELEKLLNKVEKNFHNANETKEYNLTIGGEDFIVISLTRNEKRSFIYSRPIDFDENATTDNLIKWYQPIIYKSLQLGQIAAKAKESGYIKQYYEIIDMLFDPHEIFEIIDFINEINILNKYSIVEDAAQLKKQ